MPRNIGFVCTPPLSLDLFDDETNVSTVSYKFKADADPRQLPVSGWSTPDHGGDGFDFF